MFHGNKDICGVVRAVGILSLTYAQEREVLHIRFFAYQDFSMVLEFEEIAFEVTQ